MQSEVKGDYIRGLAYFPDPGRSTRFCWLVLRMIPGFRNDVEDSSQNPHFYAQLQGLRGLLALSVLICHAVVRFSVVPQIHRWQYPPSVFYSQLGDVPILTFFFLTGFLFWSKLLRHPKVDRREYLLARFKRLGPVYCFAMVCLLLLVAIQTGFDLHTSKLDAIGSTFRWATFVLGGEPNINGLPHTRYLISGTPWTFAYELKFYVLLPFLLWFARQPYRTLYLISLSGIVFSVSTFVSGRVSEPFLLHVLSLTHNLAGHLFFSFGVGMIVALVRFRWRAPFRLAGSSFASAACLFSIVAAGLLPMTHFFSIATSVLLGIVFLAIVYGNPFWGLLTVRPMLLLGKGSYSLYLCHGLVLTSFILILEAHGVILASLAPKASWLLLDCGSMLAVFAAVLSYRLVESQFMDTQ